MAPASALPLRKWRRSGWFFSGKTFCTHTQAVSWGGHLLSALKVKEVGVRRAQFVWGGPAGPSEDATLGVTVL